MSFADSQGLEGYYGAPFAWSVLGSAALTGAATAALLFFDNADYFGFPEAFYIGLIAFLIASFVIGLSAAAIGLPLTLLLERYRLEGPLAYPVAGFIAGGALVTLLAVLTGDMRGSSIFEFYPYAWIGALPGCVCGAIWWLTYRRHGQEPGEKRG